MFVFWPLPVPFAPVLPVPLPVLPGVVVGVVGAAGVTVGAPVSLEPVAERMFNELPYDGFFIEWEDIKREGGYEALRFVPKGKMVIMGIVNSKVPEVESADSLVRNTSLCGIAISFWLPERPGYRPGESSSFTSCPTQSGR